MHGAWVVLLCRRRAAAEQPSRIKTSGFPIAISPFNRNQSEQSRSLVPLGKPSKCCWSIRAQVVRAAGISLGITRAKVRHLFLLMRVYYPYCCYYFCSDARTVRNFNWLLNYLVIGREIEDNRHQRRSTAGLATATSVK